MSVTPETAVPVFKSRRGAEALPVLRPAEPAKGFGPTLAESGWYGGFLCGVMASVGGLGIAVIVIRVLA